MAKYLLALPWLLAVLLVPLGPAGPATAAPEETGRYYVVGPPVNGQREYLYSIALVTLGNGNRFREIIDLNRGRKQPDGGTFTDGVELGPGWVLVLPRDADGPGVRKGALPAIGPPTPRSSPSTAAPSPKTAAPSPSPSVTPPPPPSAVPPSTDSPATIAIAPPPESGSGPLSPNLIRTGAAVLAVLLAVFALLVLPRRRQQLRSVGLDDGPWPPERHHTPTPAELAALATDTPTAAPSAPAESSQPSPAADPAPPPPPPSAPPPPAPPSVEPGPSPASPPPVSAPPPAVPGPWVPTTPQVEPGLSPSVPPPDWPPLAGTSPTAVPPRPVATEGPADAAADGGAADRVDLPRPTLPVDGDVPYVRTEVRTEVGSVMVRLIGVTTGPSTPAYVWLADGEPAPEAAVPLVLGRRGSWRLQVDLGRAPDVFTLVGDLDECRRLAAAYARQLRTGGIGVGVVGDALGAESVDGCRRLDGLPEPGDLDSDRYVVIIAGLPNGAGIRGLAAATGGRCVPVVIGPVPDGRWSAQLGAGV
ncbi:hypothetical protein KBX50_15790 [Micromonospora sp. C51]|uniref:hypothetical protein n=1 Tax=Micromonospora sp. C51 TaxID=2824879 RepID=UPI001B3983BB|nr:hypothetical protein [Micromonospora sp. C51]MBQ1049921.1 hypothetical protein [Micromonospora sp. C51]